LTFSGNAYAQLATQLGGAMRNFSTQKCWQFVANSIPLRGGFGFTEKILQLKKLRTSADYADAEFGRSLSEESIALSSALTATLKNYYTP
jgi:hypothetical protein